MDELEYRVREELNLTDDVGVFVFYVNKESGSPAEYETSNTVRLIWLNGNVYEWTSLIKE